MLGPRVESGQPGGNRRRIVDDPVAPIALGFVKRRIGRHERAGERLGIFRYHRNAHAAGDRECEPVHFNRLFQRLANVLAEQARCISSLCLCKRDDGNKLVTAHPKQQAAFVDRTGDAPGDNRPARGRRQRDRGDH